jgi:hypothetical protein
MTLGAGGYGRAAGRTEEGAMTDTGAGGSGADGVHHDGDVPPDSDDDRRPLHERPERHDDDSDDEEAGVGSEPA